jgi:hypothetical protein
MGWALLRDFLVNIAAGMVGDITSPTGIVGFILTLGCIAYGVRTWDRNRREVGKRGMDSWYFISLAFVVAAMAISAGAYGIGLRTANQALTSSPTQGADTHLSLNFGQTGTTPQATSLSNIWRWYALANVARMILPDGQMRDIKSWSVFLTFEKPVDVKQIIVEGQGIPQYEVKDRDARSAVIAFLGDIVNASLRIRVDSSVGAKLEPPRADTPAQIQRIAMPPVVSPAKAYFPAEKTELGNLLSDVLSHLNAEGRQAYEGGWRLGSPPEGIQSKEQLKELQDRIDRIRMQTIDLSSRLLKNGDRG